MWLPEARQHLPVMPKPQRLLPTAHSVQWIVPIPGTTKLSHLEENLRTLNFTLSADEWKQLEDAVAAIPVMGDRYNAEQQKQVGF